MPDQHLEFLAIESLRNFDAVSLNLGPGGNFFFGANGAGKTTLLEAVQILGTGRSFRASGIKPCITHESDFCRVVGRVRAGSITTTLGIERHRSGQLHARVAGQDVTSLSQLAERLPVVLLDTEGMALLTGAPDARRRFLDGTVFHVERSFLPLWRRYQRALRQRNAGLRHGTLEADTAWREELAVTGEALTEARAHTVEQLQDAVCSVVPELSDDLQKISVSLRRGWESGVPLGEVLERTLASDRRQGFTQVGPHRADLRVLVDGRAAGDVLSRGQLKVLVAGLRLAQGGAMSLFGGVRPTFLVDDLLAELDEDHARAVCRLLADRDAQVLMTAVEVDRLLDWWPHQPSAVFHVEQGVLGPQ